MDHRRKCEIERSQAEDGHDVAGVDDEGVGGDREDRRHRVHREHQVGKIDHHQRQKQRGRRGDQLARLLVGHLDEEMLVVVLFRHPHMRRYPAHRRVLRQVGLMVSREKHLDPREHQKRGEDVKHPIGLIHQRGASRDHDPAQHDHRNYAPQERAVLVFHRDRKESEDQADHEHVVDGQRLFDEESSEVLQPQFGAALDPDPCSESQGNGYVERGKLQRFGDAHGAVFLVENPQVERGQRDDDAGEGQPEPSRGTQPVSEQKFHDLLPSGGDVALQGPGQPVLEREFELLEASDLERIRPLHGLKPAQAIVEGLVPLEQAEDTVGHDNSLSKRVDVRSDAPCGDLDLQN